MSVSVPECFMAAFAAGLAFSLVYEALRVVRILLPLKAVIFVCDAVFFLLAAYAVTQISVALGNYIRHSAVIGFGAGVFAYINTIGRVMNVFENAVAGAIRAALGAVFGGLKKLLLKTFGLIAHNTAALFGEIAKIRAALVKNRRKPLKNRREIVYNKESIEENVGGSEKNHVIKAEVRRGISA